MIHPFIGSGGGRKAFRLELHYIFAKIAFQKTLKRSVLFLHILLFALFFDLFSFFPPVGSVPFARWPPSRARGPDRGPSFFESFANPLLSFFGVPLSLRSAVFLFGHSPSRRVFVYQYRFPLTSFLILLLRLLDLKALLFPLPTYWSSPFIGVAPHFLPKVIRAELESFLIQSQTTQIQAPFPCSFSDNLDFKKVALIMFIACPHRPLSLW